MIAESSIRVTSRDREAAVDELRAAYAVGCLDDDELEERISLAYTAKTRGDLAALVSDLPPDMEQDDQAAQQEHDEWHASLKAACWLLLAAAGAWLIAAAATGFVAVPLIFLWLVSLRLGGRRPRKQRTLVAPISDPSSAVPAANGRIGSGQDRAA